jgi:hypothetical protein
MRCERIAWALATAALLGGCGRPSVPETPEATYRAFYAALSERDWDLAVGFLDQGTREAFRQAGSALTRLVGAREDPMSFYLKRSVASLDAPLRRVEVIARESNGVTLQVTAGPCDKNQPCSITQVRSVREGGRWVLAPELPKALSPGHTESQP